jgi:D-alanyl-D-alanine carboxypeptidase
VRRIAIALLVAIMAMAGLAAFPGSVFAGTKQADARLDRELATLVGMPEGPPGAAVVIQREGKLRLHTAGTATLGAADPIRLNDYMRIASVTKAFTGATVLRLVERRKLGLRTTIGQLRPDMPATWHAITIRQLLYHTSGLPDYTATPSFGQAFVMNGPLAYISPQQMIDFAATEPVNFPPGAQYEYSNTDNIVLGLLAEAATRTPFATLLSRLVLRPLHLTQTSLPDQVTLPQPFIHGYVFDEPGQPPEDVSEAISPSGAWASGAIVSSPRDLNRFVRAWNKGLLQTPRVERAQRAFLPPFTGGEPPGPGQNRSGLTLYRYKTGCGIVFGHSGNFPGYTQLIAASGDGLRSLVVSVNEALNRPSTGSQAVFAQLQQVYERAACAALAK